MEEQRARSQSRRPTAQDLWRLFLAIVTVIAVVQELRKTPDERTWQGKVGGFVPYDFRRPSVERVRQTYWNPDGPFLSGKVWGAGWAPNFGAAKRLFARTPVSD